MKIFEDPYEDLQGSSKFLAKIPKDPQKSLPRSLRILNFLAKIFEDLGQDLWGSSKILKDPCRSCQDLVKIFKDPLQILPGSLRICKDPLQNLPRSLRIFNYVAKDLKRIFKDPLQTFSRSLRIFNNLAKDLQGSYRILCSSCQDLWRSSIILIKIFKDREWTFSRSCTTLNFPKSQEHLWLRFPVSLRISC